MKLINPNSFIEICIKRLLKGLMLKLEYGDLEGNICISPKPLVQLIDLENYIWLVFDKRQYYNIILQKKSITSTIFKLSTYTAKSAKTLKIANIIMT